MLTRLLASRAAHRRRAQDAGITLIEVVVGSTLLAIVGTLALRFMVDTGKNIDRVQTISYTGANARAAVEVVGGELRLADTPTARAGYAKGRFERLEANRVVFYANLDTTSRNGTAGRTPPVKVDVYVEKSNDGSFGIRQDLYRPKVAYTNNYPSPYAYAANYPTTPSSTRLLLTPIASATALTFGYCTKATDPAVTCTPALTCPTSGTCPQTTLDALGQDVAAVKVSIVPPKKKGIRSQAVQTTAAITGEVS